jgi:hypothetical protein
MYIRFTKESHPGIWRAFQALWDDNIGAQMPITDELILDIPRKGYPTKVEDIPRIEKALLDLSEDDLETFACGEAGDQVAISMRSSELSDACDFLTLMFDFM